MESYFEILIDQTQTSTCHIQNFPLSSDVEEKGTSYKQREKGHGMKTLYNPTHFASNCETENEEDVPHFPNTSSIFLVTAVFWLFLL